MYRLCRLVLMLIRVLRLWLPGRDNACSGPCYRPLKRGFFMKEFSFLDGLLGLLVAVQPIVLGLSWISDLSKKTSPVDWA